MNLEQQAKVEKLLGIAKKAIELGEMDAARAVDWLAEQFDEIEMCEAEKFDSFVSFGMMTYDL